VGKSSPSPHLRAIARPLRDRTGRVSARDRRCGSCRVRPCARSAQPGRALRLPPRRAGAIPYGAIGRDARRADLRNCPLRIAIVAAKQALRRDASRARWSSARNGHVPARAAQYEARRVAVDEQQRSFSCRASRSRSGDEAVLKIRLLPGLNSRAMSMMWSWAALRRRRSRKRQRKPPALRVHSFERRRRAAEHDPPRRGAYVACDLDRVVPACCLGGTTFVFFIDHIICTSGSGRNALRAPTSSSSDRPQLQAS